MVTTAPAPVQRIIDAVNAGDTEAFLAGFTVDGGVNDWGRLFTGSTAIRGWSDGELIGSKATLDVTEVSGTDSHVVVIAQVGGQGFNGPSTFTFDLDGDLVSLMAITA